MRDASIPAPTSGERRKPYLAEGHLTGVPTANTFEVISNPTNFMWLKYTKYALNPIFDFFLPSFYVHDEGYALGTDFCLK